MKRKFTFFGICVLICTLMISLGSCQKDYSEDIDDLQEQINQIKADVAALNTAIAQGKIITQVSTVTGGYQITFSDNSTITLNHGQNGADGADGADGATGADGFTPIIGVDAEGYWTVITSEGGTATRIQDVGGNDVKAELNDEFGVTTDGMLTIGGAETAVQIPMIVHNEETGSLQITIKDENGNFVTYNIPVADSAFQPTDLVSIASPIGVTKVLIGYGKVPSTLAEVHATLGQDGLDFAGVALDEQLRSGGTMPVILNPSGLNTEGYVFEVIKSDGSLYVLQPDSIALGYDGAFAQYAAGTSTNLYSLAFNPELDDLLAAPALTKELAVRAVKGDRELVSGYQYEVTVAADGETTFALKAGVSVAPLYVPFGLTENIMDLYDRTDLASIRTLTNGDFFKSEVVADPAGANVALSDEYVTIEGTVGTAPEANLESVTDLSDQTVNYILKTFDWTGIYKETLIDILYYAPLDTEVAPIDLGTHVLSDVPAERLLEADLTPMFDALEAEGKVALWQNQARDVRVRIYDENDVDLTGAGFDYFFLDEDGNTFPGSPNLALINVPAISNVVGVEFTVDETTVLPGNYKAVLTFNDRRAYAQGAEFEVEMPFVVENPVLSIEDLTAKKANLFNGQKLVIYGTDAAALGASILQTDVANFYYDLFNAYQNLGTIAAPVAPVVSVNDWMFVSPAANPASLLANNLGTNNERFTFNAVANGTVAEPNTEYPVELHYIYFGNPLNTENLETIIVEARSEVYDGYAENGTTPVAITNGDVVTTVTLGSAHYKVFDYLGNDLNIFAPVDTRVAGVTLEAPAAQAHLLTITANGTSWDIKGTNNVAVINPTTITIPLTLTVTDVLGLEKEYTINVTVTQP